MSRRFAGKVAVITGGARGIGLATVHEFAKEGATVVIVDLNDEAGEAAAASIRAAGGQASYFHTDVSQPASVVQLFESTLSSYGRVDVGINNAGVEFPPAPIEDVPLDKYEKIMAVNVRGVFLCMQEEIRIMRRQGGGAIVNTASQLAHVAIPGAATYTASKHAVLGFTKAAALEVCRNNIRINAVSPGAVKTPLFLEYFKGRQAEMDALVDRAPIGRAFEPVEIARAILFLASDDSAPLLGQALNLDGGCVNVKP